MEITAGVHHVDCLSFWRASPLVHLSRLLPWSILRASRRGTVRARWAIRLQALLRPGLYDAAGDANVSWAYEGAKNSPATWRKHRIFDMFPDKPKGMHWTTYDRLQLAHRAAKERALAGVARITGGQ
jgi:hypothetical protein